MLPGIAVTPIEDLVRKMRQTDHSPRRVWERIVERFHADEKSVSLHEITLATNALLEFERGKRQRQPGEDETEGDVHDNPTA